MPEQAANAAFGWYWINRRKHSLSLLCRTMQKSRRSQWKVEVLDVVTASRARARKTALIKQFRSSENDGGLNCLNGRGRLVSLGSRIRHSQAFIGSRNPRTRANTRKIKELRKTHSSRKVAEILGICTKTVLRHLRGEFGKGKYADQS
ncbi:MAG TPA: hypothetical protein VLL05_16240 [Terriglobales bacterium]|nr:hypothetical protein [Terriglobales bacterium]